MASVTVSAGAALVARARTWLLTTGWRKHRLLHVDEVPAAAWG